MLRVYEGPRGVYSRQFFVDPSPVARRLLWHVYSLGSVTMEAADPHEPFEKPGAHLFWVQSGRGELRHETGRFPLARGRGAWLIDMSKRRTYFPSARSLRISGIRFGGPGLEFWHESVGGNHRCEFVLEGLAPLRDAQKELRSLIIRQPAGWEWDVHLILTRLLGLLLKARNYFATPQSELPEPVLRVLDAISANPTRDWQARGLAQVARVSYSALRALFRASQKESLHDFLQRTRLDHARLLLCDPTLSMAQIAEKLSFSSESYFTQFFRRATGMSPTQFRRHLKM